MLTAIQGIADDPVVSCKRTVLVATSSSVSGLFSVLWGEAKLTSAGFVEWIGTPESLLMLQPSKPASTAPTATFTDGVPPKKFPDVDVDEKSDRPNGE
jgi:hypothetical protein